MTSKEEIEQLIHEFGEQNRFLIEDAISYLDQRFSRRRF